MKNSLAVSPLILYSAASSALTVLIPLSCFLSQTAVYVPSADATRGWYHDAQTKWVWVTQPLPAAVGPHTGAAATTSSMLFARLGAPKGHMECTMYYKRNREQNRKQHYALPESLMYPHLECQMQV